MAMENTQIIEHIVALVLARQALIETMPEADDDSTGALQRIGNIAKHSRLIREFFGVLIAQKDAVSLAETYLADGARTRALQVLREAENSWVLWEAGIQNGRL